MSSLTGIGDDPTPAIRREIIFAQGDSLGSGSQRIVILIGNKTTAGSETVETLTTQLLGDQDVRDRFGARSEIYQGWRTYSAIDTNATIYAYPVTEAGAASTFTVTFAGGAATDATEFESSVKEVISTPRTAGRTIRRRSNRRPPECGTR